MVVMDAPVPFPTPQPSRGRVVLDENGKMRQVGEWVLGATIGKGSFGKVKLAYHVHNHESVAVKIVDKSSISHVEDVERVYRETFILTTLKHAHIIKLYEVLDTPESIMLVMEYAGGGELYTYVQQRRRLSEVEACRLFTQILEGVEYCHRAKVIHRDLKLENILLTSSPVQEHGELNVKIADFGLSNSFKINQKMDTHCGTPSYTSPEQIAGNSYVGSAADIWSLGVILFSMIAGFLPFEASNLPSLFKRIGKAHYKCPGYVSEPARRLIESMLTVDPEKRATISELRSHAWLLMEYSDLADQIESQPEVTEDMINDAKNESQACSISQDPTIRKDDYQESVSIHAFSSTAPLSTDIQPTVRTPSISVSKRKNSTSSFREREPRSAGLTGSKNGMFEKLSIRTSQASKSNSGSRKTSEPNSATVLNSVTGTRRKKSISLSSTTSGSFPIASSSDSKSLTQPIITTKFPPISSSAFPGFSHSPVALTGELSTSSAIFLEKTGTSSRNQKKNSVISEECKEAPLRTISTIIGSKMHSGPMSPKQREVNIISSTPAYMSDTNASRYRLYGKLQSGEL